jgi:hypothetical protein
VLKYPILPALLESAPVHHRDPENFEYWFKKTSEDEMASIWFLKFFREEDLRRLDRCPALEPR